MNFLIVPAIAILLSLILIVLVFRSGKTLFKLLLGVFFLVLIFVVIYALVLFYDNLEVETSFDKTESVFLLVHEDDLLSVISLQPMEKTENFVKNLNSTNAYDKYFNILSLNNYRSVLQAYQNHEKGNLDSLLLRFNYKRFYFIDTDALSEKEGVLVKINNISFSFQDVESALESENVTLVLADIVISNSNMTPEQAQSFIKIHFGENVKDRILILFIANSASGKLSSFKNFYPLFSLKHFEAYPQNFFFKVLKLNSDASDFLLNVKKGDKDVST